MKIVKNKVAPPFKQCEIDIIYGKGVSKEGEMIDLAVEYGLMRKAGSWYEYKGEKFAQGRDSAKQYLVDHPEVKEELLVAIKAAK